MERLTKPAVNKTGNKYVSAIGSGYGVWPRIIQRLAEYEETGLTPEEINALAVAARENRLLVLPAALGTPVWSVETMCEGLQKGQWNPECMYIQDCPRHGAPCPLRAVKRPFTLSLLRRIGKTVWLTKEQAEAEIPENRRNRK